MKFCKDCKWEGRYYFASVYLCHHPAIARTEERSLVNGEIPFEPKICDKVRADENKCGSEGRFWEPNRRTRLKRLFK